MQNEVEHLFFGALLRRDPVTLTFDNGKGRAVIWREEELSHPIRDISEKVTDLSHSEDAEGVL